VAATQTTVDALVADARSGDFAVFDADGTLWEGDVTESLFARLAADGMTVDDVPAALHPLAPNPREDAFAYYQRATAFDVSLGYAWIASAFAGRRLGSLLAQRRALTDAPRVRPEMRALVAALEARGCATWIVSASPEFLVRDLALDPVHGVPVAPHRIIGVDVLLHGPGGPFSFGRCREAGDVPDLTALADHEISGLLRAPAPWYEGKVAAIRRWIDPEARPYLVAGDSQNDAAMLARGQRRLWWGAGRGPEGAVSLRPTGLPADPTRRH
jgi:phosphoserine phosphatase